MVLKVTSIKSSLYFQQNVQCRLSWYGWSTWCKWTVRKFYSKRIDMINFVSLPLFRPGLQGMNGKPGLPGLPGAKVDLMVESLSSLYLSVGSTRWNCCCNDNWTTRQCRSKRCYWHTRITRSTWTTWVISQSPSHILSSFLFSGGLPGLRGLPGNPGQISLY